MSKTGEKSFHDWNIENPVETFISFKETKTIRVTFDPNAVVRVFSGGKYGDTPAVSVEIKPGQIGWLRIKAKGLREQLQKIKSRSLIEITQEGEGAATRYKVKVISK